MSLAWAAAAGAALCGEAAAKTLDDAPQTPRSPETAEIIVTARKRDESLGAISQAVSALTAQQLGERGVGDLEALQFQAPNFIMGQQLGSARVTLRGVGLDNISASADGSVAVHGDGVVYARPAAALGAFFDLERIEVLRGPQGTLYGRNATGGSVNLISRKPTPEPSGFFTATGGNYDLVSIEGAIGGPILDDRVLGRLAVKTVDRSGFGRNRVTGHDVDDAATRAIRGQLAFVVSPRLNVLLRAEYFTADDRAYGYHFINPFFDDAGFSLTPLGAQLGGQMVRKGRDVANDVDSKNRRHVLTLSSVVAADLGSLRAKSISAFQETTYLTRSDLDVSSAPLAPLYQSEDARQFSQEFQVTRDGVRWNWLAGAYYFEERIDAYFDVPLSTAIFGSKAPYLADGYYAGGRIRTTASALFGEIAYRFAGQAKLTLGARYSYERKRGEDRTRLDLVTPDIPGPGQVRPPILATPGASHSAFTPRVVLENPFTKDLLVYASASRGFKSGGINLGGLQPVVRPERVTTYEVGLKSDAHDARWRLNLAAFYNDYKDLQVGLVRSNVLVLENAATASIYGVELELAAALDAHLTVDLTASYLHARYDDFVTQDQARPGQGNIIDPSTGEKAFQLAGNRLSLAPDASINVGVAYAWDTDLGVISLRSEVYWVDDIYFTPFNLRSAMQPAHVRQNIFVNWTSAGEGWRGQVFVRNIDGGDDVGNAFVASTLVGNPVIGSYQNPRTFGVSITRRF